jgi:hypothetical protein
MKYNFTALADNYDVPRGYLRGMVDTEQGYDRKSDVLAFEAAPKDAHHAVYVLDFGDRVEVRYVSGWQPKGNLIYLQPFPLSVGTRPDNGRPIDMSTWMHKPRRAFHLKLKEA